MKWKDLHVTEGQVLMMMGSAAPAAAVPLPPSATSFTEKDADGNIIHVKDQKEDLFVPSGLMNLGNTCYFNATVQCLGRNPEFKSDLIKQSLENGSAASLNSDDSTGRLVQTMGSMFTQMKKAESIPPLAVLQV